ncbi:hypothetical protein KAM339_011160 [Aeromonas caviae]|nr:hypothetical protein KAM339_011160 [Aeromonas caviae]
MIGQSVINIKSGGRGRLSTFVAGTLLILMVVFMDEWIRHIPMAALVAVMIMVSIGTFSWESVRNLKSHPLSTNLVMVTTVAVVVATHNLALGVFVGVLLASLFFAHKVARVMLVKSDSERSGAVRTYLVRGQVFFASAEQFLSGFDFREEVEKVVIDLTHAHFWDITAITALDKVVIKFRRERKEVALIGLNDASATLVDRFAIHDKRQEGEPLMAEH